MNYLLAPLVAAALQLAASADAAAVCDSATVGVNLGTYHTDRTKGYQEFNPGVYVVCDGFVAGVYRNSFGRATLDLGYVLHLVSVIDITAGITYGYRKSWREPDYHVIVDAHGYMRQGAQQHEVLVLPMLTPSVKVWDARVSLLLPIGAGNLGGVHASYEF